MIDSNPYDLISLIFALLIYRNFSVELVAGVHFALKLNDCVRLVGICLYNRIVLLIIDGGKSVCFRDWTMAILKSRKLNEIGFDVHSVSSGLE